MKRIILLLVILPLVAVTTRCKQPAGAMALKYLVKEPAAINDHTPVILLMHGYGSNENDLFGLADQLPKEALIISARAPYPVAANAYSWYYINFSTPNLDHNPNEAEKSRQTILRFIDQIVSKYHINPKLVYLMGFSQGAILSYSIGLTQPEKIRGIVVLSGKILPEIKPKAVSAEKLKPLSVFIAHGIDDKVLPVANARDANLFLTGLQLKPSYHEYGMGHQIIPSELADINEWLAQLIKAE